LNDLFAYGTLRDPEFQRELFGRALPMRSATLPDWATVITESGYLTIVAWPGNRLAGALLTLDDDALAIADAWEEVPLYDRQKMRVSTHDGVTLDAWVYVRATPSRERAPDGALAAHDRLDIIADIRRFRAGITSEGANP